VPIVADGLPALAHTRGRAVPEVLTASCASRGSPCVLRVLDLSDGHALREIWTAGRIAGARAEQGRVTLRISRREIVVDLASPEDLAGRGGASVAEGARALAVPACLGSSCAR
jgi:hypothetical protein